MPALSEQASIHQPSTAAATSIVPEQPEVSEIAAPQPNPLMVEMASPIQVKQEVVQETTTNTSEEDFQPVLVENTTPSVSRIKTALFGKSSLEPSSEQIRQREEIDQAISQVTEKSDVSKVKDASVEAVNMYHLENTQYVGSESEEESRDITARKLSAGLEIVENVDEHGKPENPREAMLRADVPLDTALAVQEAQGENRLEGITFQEAVANQAADQILEKQLESMKQESGSLDREKTARVLATVGQESLTADEFREIKQTVSENLAKTDVASLSDAQVGIRDRELVIVSDSGDIITTLDKTKATVVLADAMAIRKTSNGELSQEDQMVVTLEGKIRKTGFALSSWRDEMSVNNGEVINKGKFSETDVVVLPDGSKVVSVKQSSKCVLQNEMYKYDLKKNFSPIDPNALAECPVTHETLPPGVQNPHSEDPLHAVPHIQNEKPPTAHISSEQVSQQPVQKQAEGLPGHEGQVQVNQENAAVAQIAKPPTIVIGDSLRAAFASADQVGAFLYTLRQRPTIFQGVFPGFVPGRSFDFLTKGMNPFFASRDDNLFRINQHTARLGGRAAENSLQGQVFSVSRSESVAKINQSKAASVRAEQRVATHEAKATNKSHNVSENAQEVRHTQHATTEGASEATVSASSTTTHAEAVHTQQSNTEQKAYAGETSKASGQIAQEAHHQAIATGSIEVKAVESSGVVRKGTHEEFSTRQDTKVVASAAKEKGRIHVDNTTSSSVESAESVQRAPVGAETVVKASQESVAQEKSFAQNEVVQYEILHMLTADVGTVIATGVPVLPEGERNKKGTQETIGEDEQVRSLGTNETNMRLDPAMLMSTITRQSFSQPSAQPNSSSAKAIQKPVQVPQIKATLSLARTFSASQNFPVADQHEAKDFVNNVFARM